MVLYRDETRAAFIRQTIGDDGYVHVFGEADNESEDEFRASIRESARTAKRVIVDLTRCTYIGSQGFAVLAAARSLCDLAIIAPARVKRLVDIVGLSSLILDA